MSGAGFEPGHGLHDRLHLLAHLLVRHAEHRCVGDFRMGDQQVLAFLRIDVDAAGDDHEGGAVGEIDVAVLVDAADVADRAHHPVGRVSLGRLDRIVEVFERRGGLEPEPAGLPGRHFPHRVVEDVNLAQNDASDRAGMSEPFGAVAHGETHAFGRAVIFVDDRPPPLDHRPLDRNRTRRGAVDHRLERGEIVAAAHALGQFQHAREHRRHELRMGNATLFDETETLLLVEALHDHERAAESDRPRRADQRRRMIERRRHQIGHGLAKAPGLDVARKHRMRLRRRKVIAAAAARLWDCRSFRTNKASRSRADSSGIGVAG